MAFKKMQSLKKTIRKLIQLIVFNNLFEEILIIYNLLCIFINLLRNNNLMSLKM